MKNLIVITLLMGLAACSRPQYVQPLQPEAFEAAITQSDVQLVDVRTRKEYLQGHIEGAIHIDYLQRSSFRSKFEKLEKDQPVYLYCLRGPRSRKAARILHDMGFSEVYDLQGGYRAWLRKND
jgi:rhodanese-related sulfurtransferase